MLPQFLEFARGTVLVAHNAPFDVGFLQHFAAQLGHPWPRFEVLDTAKLARRVITRDDAPNCKLSSLAVVFQSSTTPNHRALSDARATVDVLHGLMARLGNLGVHTLEELQTFSSRVTPAQRRKRHLAEQLPHAPGVYLFRDERDRVLYVGTSKDLRTRVRTYFTASETRSRMGEMVTLAARVEGIECATALEAEVRELRLIAQHKPRYNRRSRFPERVHWIKLTREPWPRLSMVRRVVDDEADYLGPYSSKKAAERAVAALHEAFPIRQCGGRMPRVPAMSACALAEMGKCLSPCNGSVTPADYAAVVAGLRASLLAQPDSVIASLSQSDEQARGGEPVRGRGVVAGTAHLVPARRLSHPAPSRPHAVCRGGRRATRGRAVVRPRRAARPPRGRRRHPFGRRRRRVGPRSSGVGRDRRRRSRGRPRRRLLRRPRRSCAGSSRTG